MSDFKQLQPRNGHKQTAFFQKKVDVTTNLYEIRCDKLPQAFYRYDVVTISNQQLQRTSIEFRQLNEKKDKFFKTIDHIYSNTKYYIGLVKTEETHQIIDRTHFKKTVTLSKTYNLQQFFSDLGISLGLRKLIGPQIGKLGKKHLALQEEEFMKTSIFIQPKICYDFITFKEKYYLSTNIKLSINEGESLVKYFSIYDQESLKLMLIGRMVVTNYGQPKVYKIKDIDFTKTSLTQATLDNKSQSFSEYFKQKYTFQIRNPNFALLVVTAKYGNSQRSILLPPEAASLYNDINANKPEDGAKERIKKRKLLLPQQKQPSTLKVIGQLSDSEVIKRSALNLDAWRLRSPAIRFQSTNRSIEPLEGIFPVRGKISRPIDIFNWGIVYVQSGNKDADSRDLGSLIYCMRTVCSQYGIKITNESGFIPVQGDINNWKKLIKDDVTKYGAPQFLIFFLSEQESKFYPSIKEYTVKDLKFQSQVVKRKIFSSESKRQFSITGDILLQINAKIGGILWQVAGDNQLSRKKLMVGAYSVKKDEKGYKISLVGNLNAQSTNYFSISKSKLQQLKQITLQDYIICWAKSYVISNRCPPEVIIVYREVCSELENKEMISSDIQKIKRAIKTIGQKTKIANYKPDIAVITVDQRQSMELYSRGQNQDQIGNPKAGTVVRQEAQNLFYLSSSEDFFTTTKCMKYKIQESSQIDHQDLISLTYDQCYSYFNFKGSLSYPACLQYAYKLMKFTDITGVELSLEDKMTNKLYYL